MANYTIIGGDNKEYGPVTEAELRQWIAEGRLNAQSRAKAESDAEFRALAQFPEFAEALRPQAPGIIAPPGGGTGGDVEDWQAEVLARDPELKLGECLAAGWSFLGANAGFLAGAAFLTAVMHLVLMVIVTTIPLLGTIVMLCLIGVVMGGFYLACLRRLRGQPVSPAEVFSGFREAFVPLLLTGLVSGLLAELGFCCLLLPGIYLSVAWFFALPLVADKKIFFWAGMELSRKVVTRVWFEALVLAIIAFLPVVIFQVYNMVQTGRYFMGLYNEAGQNMQQFAQQMQAHASDLKGMGIRNTLIGEGVLLLNLFYCAGVIVRAYENLFGTKKP